MTTELDKRETALSVRHFDASILAGQVRATTIAMYKKAFGAYLAFAGSWAQALDPATLAQWRTVLANTELSPNTVNRMLSSVRAVMKTAAEQGYVSSEVYQRFEAVRGVKVGAMKDKLKEEIEKAQEVLKNMKKKTMLSKEQISKTFETVH